MPRTVVVERDWDNESVQSERPKKTTVRRYKVPDRSTYDDDRQETDIKITRRETERERPQYQDVRYEREVERERPVREYRVTREVERAPSPPEPEYREWRVERDIPREAPRRRAPYELERYTRDVEWVREPERPPQEIIIRQEAPQPIIIRESAPAQEIIIREEPKADESRSVAGDRRSEIDNRSLVRRDPDPRQDDEDESYYYKRVTRQVQRRPEWQEDDYDDRDYEREPAPRRDVDPRDSVSNHGGDYSDDEYYYKKTTEEWNGRDRSPHHRLHLAEGAAVGLAGAALLQNRNKRNGEKAGGAGRLAGGAALGAIGAELITRARSRHRSRSRRRSRSRSEPGVSGVVKLGAVAALGALAAYAASRNNNNNANKAGPNERRSRSRRRRSSVARDGSGSDTARDRDMRDPSTRNATIAKAGLASAAVAGLVERVRSKSRGNRNRSLGRTAIPVAAAGLGGAALAGLYTKNKAEKQEGVSKRKSRSRRRSPSGSSRPTSRSRSVAHADGQENSNAGNQNLVVYGNDPIPPPDSMTRPRSRADSLYGDGGNAGRERGSPSSSRSSSPRRDRNKHRHRNEREDDAGAAGLSGAAASSAAERRQRKRQEREQRRLQERQETPSNAGWGPYAEPAPVNPAYQYQPAAQYQQPANQSYYPQTTNFPPPPQNNYSPAPGPPYGHATYNPAEYSAPGATPGHAQQAGVTAATESQWYPPATQNHQYGGNYNVSRPNEASKGSDGVDAFKVARAVSAQPTFQRRKSVQFDLGPTEHQYNRRKTVSNLDGDDWDAPDGRKSGGKTRSFSVDSPLINSPHQRTRQRDGNRSGNRRLRLPGSSDSGETIVLPDRFDRDGRRIPDRPPDPLADRIEAILSGRGVAGKLFHRFAGDLIGIVSARRL